MGWKACLVLATVVTLYLILGGYLFYLVENDDTVVEQYELMTFAQDFLDAYPGVDPGDVEILLKSVLNASVNGILENNKTRFGWTLTSGIYFAGTVITTIGYGVMAPATTAGQWLTIFYGIIGIPLNLIMLAHIGESMKKNTQDVILKCLRCCNMGGVTYKTRRLIGVIVVILIGLFMYLLLPAVIFMELEPWSFTQSIYFTFVTLSTIGFGDLNATTDTDAAYTENYLALYRLVFTFWMFLGLAWLSTLMSLMVEIFQEGVEKGMTLKDGIKKSLRVNLMPVILRGGQARRKSRNSSRTSSETRRESVSSETSAKAEQHTVKMNEEAPGRSQKVSQNDEVETYRSSTGDGLEPHPFGSVTTANEKESPVSQKQGQLLPDYRSRPNNGNSSLAHANKSPLTKSDVILEPMNSKSSSDVNES